MVNQHIQKLIDAEQQADAIVKKAKENWVKKVKEAQSSAAQECEKFGESEEEKFRREYAEKFAAEDPTKNLEEQTKNDIEEIKHQYKRNRDSAVSLLLSGVVRVDTNPSPADIRRLKLHYLKTSA
ncbi:vacuolar (H+)-ATPase G subunit [Gregarina niphandrodes]|uniref:Vacuolar (H+)-ATPase G subunit n=1 Tax=Gregarina niphandrodes TaxID=110365 RepID=A0A023B167_GRENI|nr:vacuolar (H+)-ATPase G subunit [Gregarina niphandrodes]EZG46253.1 vacuolar (H+)-ATPase G subunit [Gregarina niphandrodes]|eukprot:XP_011132323.1 vacuolar (H+)-ATPase G subunit [Gregarina niphandrodes]